jgi:hypothetical protein
MKVTTTSPVPSSVVVGNCWGRPLHSFTENMMIDLFEHQRMGTGCECVKSTVTFYELS